jgi:hypothetical protein
MQGYLIGKPLPGPAFEAACLRVPPDGYRHLLQDPAEVILTTA